MNFIIDDFLTNIKHAISWNLSYIGWLIYVVGALLLLGIVITGIIKKPKYTNKYRKAKQIVIAQTYSVLIFVIGLLIAGFAFIIWTAFQKSGVPANVWKVQRGVGLVLVFLAFPCVVLSLIIIIRDFWWFFYYQFKVKKYDADKNRVIIERQKLIKKLATNKSTHSKKSKIKKTSKNPPKNKYKKNPFEKIASSYQQSQNRIRIVAPAKNNDMDLRLEHKDFKDYVAENNKHSKNVDRKIAIMMLAVGTVILGIIFFWNGVHHSRPALFDPNQMNIVLGLNVFFNLVGMFSCIRSIVKCFMLYYGLISNKRILKLRRVNLVHDTTLALCFTGLFFVNLGLISVGN